MSNWEKRNDFIEVVARLHLLALKIQQLKLHEKMERTLTIIRAHMNG